MKAALPFIKITLLVALGFAYAQVLAQEDGESTASGPTADDGQSGYEDLPQFGGPESVTAKLKTNDEEREYVYQFDGIQRVFSPWFDWKRRVNDDNGVSMGFSAYMLYQKASDSLAGADDDALGYIFRYQGNWTFRRSPRGNDSRIEWRVESRSNIGSFQAPGSLGGAIGVATLAPGFAYNEDFDLDLAIINWTQGFNGNTAGFAVGRLAFDVYLDAFPFQTFSKGNLNRAPILNPTLPTTGIGAIGGVVKGFVTDNIVLGAQIHDANAVSGEFDFDTVQEGEFLKAIEFKWTPSFAQRNTHLVQFTYWDKDERELAGVSDGSGWAVSAAWQLNDRYFPFARFGHSDGGGGVAAESAVSAGVQITYNQGEIWTISGGWAKPSRDTFGPGLDNETVLESSYMFQLSKNFSLTPDLQLIFNPANNPDESSIWVFGLRGILTL